MGPDGEPGIPGYTVSNSIYGNKKLYICMKTYENVIPNIQIKMKSPW